VVLHGETLNVITVITTAIISTVAAVENPWTFHETCLKQKVQKRFHETEHVTQCNASQYLLYSTIA